MRALWISDYFPRPHDPTTGVWAFETVRGLQRQGCDVEVLAPTPWIPRAAAWSTALRRWASVPPAYQLMGVPVHAPRCLHYPHRLVERHLYRRWPQLDTELVWQGCRPAVESLLRRARFDVVHANFVFPAGYLGWRIKRAYRIPMVIHERSPLRLAAAMSRPARQALYTRLVREANALITLNGHLAAQLQRVGRQPVHVIPAGADPASASAAEAPRPERYAASVVVLCVGAFIPRKGHDILLRAVERLRPSQLNLHVILIGGGPQRRAVERQIAQRGLEGCVEVWGRRPPREVLAAMSWCDIFALPSWDEAFGTVYAEAMACGRPIVACRGEGIEDVVSDGSQGLLVPARDAEALAGALGRLAADAELRRAMGEAARQLAHSRLTYDVIARTILAIYETLPSAGALHAHLSDLC